MNPDSEQILNQFAAGEMTLQQERDFLAFCEMEPERYRKATLAVVEHRRVSSALQAFALPEGTEEVAPPRQPVPSRPPVPPSERNAGVRGLQHFAIAAGLLVFAAGGYWLGSQSEDPPTGDSMIAVEDIQPDSNQLAVEAAVPTPNPDQRVAEPPVPELQPVVDPFLVAQQDPEDLRDVLEFLRPQPLFDQQSRERLRQRGFQVEESPQVYLFTTDDGHRYAVPSQNVNIRFVKQ